MKNLGEMADKKELIFPTISQGTLKATHRVGVLVHCPPTTDRNFKISCMMYAIGTLANLRLN